MSQEINLVINFNEKTGEFSYEMAIDESQCKARAEILPDGLQPLISCSTCSDNWAFKIYLNKHKTGGHHLKSPPKISSRVKTEPVEIEIELDIQDFKEESPEPADELPAYSAPVFSTSKSVKPSAGNFAHDAETRSLLRRVKKINGNSAFHHSSKLQNDSQIFITRLNDGGNVYVANFDMRPLKCDICSQKIKDLTSFLRHRKLHFIEIGDLTCNACKTEYRNQNEIAYHTLICPKKYLIKPLHCKFCGVKIDNYKAQRLHEKFHVRGPPKWAGKKREEKMCHLCPKVCSNQEQLKFHLRKFHEIDPFLCAFCPKKFGQRNLIRVHLVEAHFKHLADYRCEKCGKVFCLQKSLDSHRAKTHMDIKEPCTQCGKLIKTLSMAAHIERQHTSAVHRRKFPCTVCGKTFLTKAHADSHEISHLPKDAWKFGCKFCDKRYPDKHNLATHERIHKNGPEHICSTCGKAFTTKQYLADHINLHTGLKPYECKVCQKRFSDRGNLRFHLKNHEKQMGVKLTMTIDERRIMKQQGSETNMFM